jgi:putative CocE/NonD family hydrolase
MGANQWLDLPSWPPPGAAQASLYLDSDGRANSRFGDGRLSATPPTTESRADEWVHDPDRPVPFITDASSAQIGGPDDYAGVQTRADVLVYTSDVLNEPLDLIGPVRLVAHVETSAEDADFTAMLLDLHPNGFAQRLCDGLLRLRYRSGHDEAVDVQPGALYEIEVVMWDTCQRFAPGHRIQLSVASSAHPKYASNLGIAGDQTTSTEGKIATNRLHHGAAHPSRLVLTVAAAGLFTEKS